MHAQKMFFFQCGTKCNSRYHGAQLNLQKQRSGQVCAYGPFKHLRCVRAETNVSLVQFKHQSWYRGVLNDSIRTSGFIYTALKLHVLLHRWCFFTWNWTHVQKKQLSASCDPLDKVSLTPQLLLYFLFFNLTATPPHTPASLQNAWKCLSEIGFEKKQWIDTNSTD